MSSSGGGGGSSKKESSSKKRDKSHTPRSRAPKRRNSASNLSAAFDMVPPACPAPMPPQHSSLFDSQRLASGNSSASTSLSSTDGSAIGASEPPDLFSDSEDTPEGIKSPKAVLRKTSMLVKNMGIMTPKKFDQLNDGGSSGGGGSSSSGDSWLLKLVKKKRKVHLSP